MLWARPDPPSPGGAERGRDEGGDFLAARLIVGLSAESGFYIACRDAIKTGLSSERRTSYFQRVNLTRYNALSETWGGNETPFQCRGPTG